MLEVRSNSDEPISESKYQLGDELLLVASSVHGVNPPASLSFSQVVSNEIHTMVMEGSFSELGYPEVLLAIRLNGRNDIKFPAGLDLEKIKFFGSFVSVDFISQILMNYMTVRNLIDRKIQNHIDGY